VPEELDVGRGLPELVEQLIDQLRKTRTNVEFLRHIARSTS